MDRNTLKAKLLEIFERCMGDPVENVQDNTNLKSDLNLDSIDFVTMAIEVQSEFDIELKTTELAGIVTFKDLLDLILSKLTASGKQAA